MFPNTYVVVRTLLQKQSDGIGIKQFTFLLDIWFPFMSRLEHVIEKLAVLSFEIYSSTQCCKVSHQTLA